MKINPIVLFALSSSAVVLAAPTPQGWNLLKSAGKLVGKGKGESSSAAREIEEDFKWDALPEGYAGGSSKAPSVRSSPEHVRADIEQPAPQRPVTPPSAAAPAVQAHPGAQYALVAAPQHAPMAAPQHAPSGPPAPGMHYNGPPGGHYPAPPPNYYYPRPDDSMAQYLHRHQGDPRYYDPDTEWLTWSAAERHQAQMDAEKAKERTGWFW